MNWTFFIQWYRQINQSWRHKRRHDTFTRFGAIFKLKCYFFNIKCMFFFLKHDNLNYNRNKYISQQYRKVSLSVCHCANFLIKKLLQKLEWQLSSKGSSRLVKKQTIVLKQTNFPTLAAWLLSWNLAWLWKGLHIDLASQYFKLAILIQKVNFILTPTKPYFFKA